MVSNLQGSEHSQSLIKTMKPFLEEHCVRCHGPKRERGGLRIDLLTVDLVDFTSLDHFQNMLDEMAIESMPPEDEPQPAPKTVVRVSAALTEHIRIAKERHNSGGGKPARRLTQIEFINTVSDVLGVHILPRNLPEDGTVGSFE